jgi:hypothetical protein
MVEFVLAIGAVIATAVAISKHFSAAQLKVDLASAKAAVVSEVNKVKATVIVELAKVAPSASADVQALVVKIKAVL